jgi:hypothetical protein
MVAQVFAQVFVLLVVWSSLCAQDLIPYRKGAKWGFADKNRVVQIAPTYDNAGRFVNGFARVQVAGKWGLVNAAGKELLPTNYEWVEDATLIKGGQQKAVLAKLGGKWGMFDAQTGTALIQQQYEEIRLLPDGNLALKQQGKWGFTDNTGKELLAAKYDQITMPTRGVIRVQLGGKWGAVDSLWREVLAPKYEQLGSTFNGFTPVQIGDKFGMLNAAWKEIVPPKYDAIGTMTLDGLAAVELKTKWGFVDTTGKEVIEAKYDKISDFTGGFARVQSGGKWGFVSTTGVEFWEE